MFNCANRIASYELLCRHSSRCRLLWQGPTSDEASNGICIWLALPFGITSWKRRFKINNLPLQSTSCNQLSCCLAALPSRDMNSIFPVTVENRWSPAKLYTRLHILQCPTRTYGAVFPVVARMSQDATIASGVYAVIPWLDANSKPLAASNTHQQCCNGYCRHFQLVREPKHERMCQKWEIWYLAVKRMTKLQNCN